jgi:hypothetical protein
MKAAKQQINVTYVGIPRGKGESQRWVLVVNQVRNAPRWIRRKDASWLVKKLRAAWISDDQIRLNMAIPDNKDQAAEAKSGYETAVMPAHDGDRPDLSEMRKHDKERYVAMWRGAGHIGKIRPRAPLGNAVVYFPPTSTL